MNKQKIKTYVAPTVVSVEFKVEVGTTYSWHGNTENELPAENSQQVFGGDFSEGNTEGWF